MRSQNLKSLEIGLRSIMVIANKYSIIFLIFLLSACADNKIYVDIDRNDYREKYIENLQKINIKYKMAENNEIIIFDETFASLDNKLTDYDAYVQLDIEKQNSLRNKNSK